MPYTDDPQVQTMVDNMPEKTGKSLPEWFDVVRSSGLEKHGDIMKLLKGDHGVTHGFANTITLIYRQQAEGGQPSGTELIDTQYANKVDLKPVYNRIADAVGAFGPDVVVAPKKTYVSFRRAKQFAIVQPSTKTRIDLGLNLKNVTPSGVLIEGDKWSGMCSHRIEIHGADAITPEVIYWLRIAYEGAG